MVSSRADFKAHPAYSPARSSCTFSGRRGGARRAAHRHLPQVKRDSADVVGAFVGSIAAIASAVLLARYLVSIQAATLALAPKPATAAIAMGAARKSAPIRRGRGLHGDDRDFGGDHRDTAMNLAP